MKRLTEYARVRKSLYTLIIASFFVVTWGWTHAHAGGERPCSGDIAKYCKDLEPGGGGIIRCLRDNENRLSNECKARVEKSVKRFEAAREACAADVERFCKGIEPGGGRIARCLAKHANELSPECCAKCDLAREKKGGG